MLCRTRALEDVILAGTQVFDERFFMYAEDIDLCMILGAGWPMFLGGITPYLDRVGASERVNGRKFLAPGVASEPA